MEATDRQYERIARWLDGERVLLDPQEQALAEQIRRQELAMGLALDAAVPPQAMERARRRMIAALASPARRLRWVGLAASAAGLAAAAAVALVVMLSPGPGDTGRPIAEQPPAKAREADWAAEWLRQLRARPEEAQFEVLATAIDELRAELAMSTPGNALDMQLEAVEQSIEDFWSEDRWLEPLEVQLGPHG